MTRINYCTQHTDPWSTKGNYIHRTSEGWEAYRDGNYAGDGKTYRQAAQHLFMPRGYGGYDLAYYPIDDDEMAPISLCADCALSEFLSDPAAQFHVELEDGDNRYESGTYCDACSCEITPHLCVECGDDLADTRNGRTWFGNYYAIHQSCLAKQVIKGHATKAGKLAYTVDLDAEWFGGQTYTVPME